ncbi:hypothetical protein GXP67_33895 [Rhodocytophaga rosea]|uniref:VIT family protein n=1 Tax=Rhodocytophaga rosea TaxID=2704465 RepID=A0A6C0GT12_9BACT|nr:VIT1/CCC1 transporter family protein [Rhodocytophaga rosea]QHT71295.1 hypothetical protein GXP67_33895 [Rhodocytophaga rosea]
MPEENLSDAQQRTIIEAAHTQESIRKRLQNNAAHSYLKDLVYGAVDGTVTTFAVVSGVAGAQLSPSIIIIMGLANLLADGFSMAVSNYLGTRTENELLEKTRAEELRQIRLYPEGEKEEIRQIFAGKGFTGEHLEKAVDIITANPSLWTNTMLQEEHNLSLYGATAWKAALATFIAFVLIGIIPVFPFLWNWGFGENFRQPFVWSSILTGFAFFGIGSVKSRFVGKTWYSSGLETLLLGGGAAVLAYLVGILLKGIGE